MKVTLVTILSGRPVEYQFERKNVRNINLRIRRDKTVAVSAPYRVSAAAVEMFLQSRTKFILAALDFYDNKKNDKQSIITNGNVIILGKQIALSVEKGAKNTVSATNEKAVLSLTDTGDEVLAEKTYNKWADKYCKEIIGKICRDAYAVFKEEIPTFPLVKFRRMKSRSGSCKFNGGIVTFNLHLFEKPVECIEYVVYHEFTHFSVPNHSAEFYKRLAQKMPDWKERKKRLDVQTD